MNRTLNFNLPVYMTIFCAILLLLVPRSYLLTNLMPNMVLLVIIYWLYYRPGSLSLGSVWFMGIVHDLLSFSLLGLHALIYTLAAYIVKKSADRSRNLTFIEYIPWIVVSLILDTTIFLIATAWLQDSPVRWELYYSVFTGMFVWPWIYLLLSIVEYFLYIKQK